MAPSKFDLMKDMDAVLREAERERARVAAFRAARTVNRSAVQVPRSSISAANPFALAAGVPWLSPGH